MDYKKIIKNRAVRIRIMQALSFVPDKTMVSLQYRIKTGRKLNLKNPQRYTEKLQWYKLYYRDPVMAQCVDKYEVRKYVERCGLADILNECYGVYNSPDEIDFDALPAQFVLKDTLGGGGNAVILVKDKSAVDWIAICDQMKKWVNESIYVKTPGREWVYEGKKHRIIAERYIPSNPEKGGLIDYKFLCFNGKAELLYVLADRTIGHGAECGFFDLDFQKLPVTESDEEPLKRKILPPLNYREMVRIAENLAGAFPCARIDLYNVEGRTVFGEITFFDSSGYMCFEPDEFDFKMGAAFDLPENKE